MPTSTPDESPDVTILRIAAQHDLCAAVFSRQDLAEAMKNIVAGVDEQLRAVYAESLTDAAWTHSFRRALSDSLSRNGNEIITDTASECLDAITNQPELHDRPPLRAVVTAGGLTLHTRFDTVREAHDWGAAALGRTILELLATPGLHTLEGDDTSVIAIARATKFHLVDIGWESEGILIPQLDAPGADPEGQ